MDETAIPAGKESTTACKCHAAALAILDAHVFLLCTGAGFSADSGLPTYSDISKIPSYHDRGLKYSDLCDPAWSQNDLATFYGFWGACFNDFRCTTPHRGYGILAKWRDTFFTGTHFAASLQKRLKATPLAEEEAHACDRPYEAYKVKRQPGAFYAYTSNIDAHVHDHFHAGEVRECHGNTEFWQCSDVCCERIWRAPTNYMFKVNSRTLMAANPSELASNDAQEMPPQDEASTEPIIGKPVTAIRQTLLAGLPKYVETKQSRAMFRRQNRPVCPRCGVPARPAVLMFMDLAWVDNVMQEKRYRSWLQAVQDECQERRFPPINAVILEIGAGKCVPTVRMNSQDFACRLERVGANVHLIRVNPRDAGPDGFKGARLKRFLEINAKGLECLQMIDAEIDAILEQRGQASGGIPQPTQSATSSTAQANGQQLLQEPAASSSSTESRKQLL
eukprot:CAMPEP_0172777066 /NCGR_PEP_ID=MMETSP1074-20121228/201097_1 /TAXON_ID=2916 /ORGANISM="Ceratium fusus, Strain PA161109" /LENGTH=447 /DNA_ID=CAMNT_0013613951 /DNA_START=144 /DNA_END=1487 /DNA_ORIENTATION=+